MILKQLRHPVTALDGTPIRRAERGAVLILAEAIVEALTLPARDETIDPIKGFRNYELAKRIIDASELDLTIEEAASIKERVAKVWPAPMVFGPIWDALEGIPLRPIREPQKEG